jgi:hypothetical protein
LQQKIIKLALTAKKMEALRVFAQEGELSLLCSERQPVFPPVISLFSMTLS